MSGSGESIIKTLVRYNMGDTAVNCNRAMPFIEYAEDLYRGDFLSFSTDYKRLDEEVASIAALSGLGIKVVMDAASKKFIFDVYVGRDLRSIQNTFPPVIFSSEYDNVFSQCYTESRVSHRNVAVVESRGEGAARGIVVVGDEIYGENRREMYVSGRDIAAGEVDKQTERGLSRLNETSFVKSLDGEVNSHHSLKYGTDYRLGDLVTMMYGEEVLLHVPITEVCEKWTIKSGYGLSLMLGKAAPTLIDRIKQSIGQ
jgi:hypothetical protein